MAGYSSCCSIMLQPSRRLRAVSLGLLILQVLCRPVVCSVSPSDAGDRVMSVVLVPATTADDEPTFRLVELADNVDTERENAPWASMIDSSGSEEGDERRRLLSSTKSRGAAATKTHPETEGDGTVSELAGLKSRPQRRWNTGNVRVWGKRGMPTWEDVDAAADLDSRQSRAGERTPSSLRGWGRLQRLGHGSSGGNRVAWKDPSARPENGPQPGAVNSWRSWKTTGARRRRNVVAPRPQDGESVLTTLPTVDEVPDILSVEELALKLATGGGNSNSTDWEKQHETVQGRQAGDAGDDEMEKRRDKRDFARSWEKVQRRVWN